MLHHHYLSCTQGHVDWSRSQLSLGKGQKTVRYDFNVNYNIRQSDYDIIAAVISYCMYFLN